MNSRYLRWLLAGGAAASVVAVVVVAIVLLSGGGDSNGSTDDQSADEIAQKVGEAILQPSMVFHVTGTDGSAVWIDTQARKYRRRDADSNGGLTSVGSGWSESSYDVLKNEVTDSDNTPTSSQPPRINDPMVRWLDPLGALAFGNSLTVTGRTTVNGAQVIIIDATTPVLDKNGNLSGTLRGHVEVDATSYLPIGFEVGEVLANGTTATPAVQGVDPHVKYTSEFIARSTLPADFFDRSIVEQQIKTNQKVMDQIRGLGLTPAWFGDYYDGTPYGELQLPPTISVSIDPQSGSGEIDYALVSATSVAEGAVVIRMLADATQFTHPTIPQYAGNLPETKETVTVGGETATLYTSILTIDALPCTSGDCPHSSAALYRRLVLQRGDTAIQIEVTPKLDGNTDVNGFNSRDGIVSLAGALQDVPADIATP